MFWSNRFSKLSHTSATSQLNRKSFRRFTYVKVRSPTLSLLHLHDSSFSNLSFASPTSQDLHLCHLTCHACSIVMINLQIKHMFCSSLFSNISDCSRTSELVLQPFRHFTYVTGHSPTLPLLQLRDSSFSNPSFASPTSQDLHLLHLANRPCSIVMINRQIRHMFWSNPFSNLSGTSPTSQHTPQHFRRFTYGTVHSPRLPLLHLCDSSFSNPF